MKAVLFAAALLFQSTSLSLPSGDYQTEVTEVNNKEGKNVAYYKFDDVVDEASVSEAIVFIAKSQEADVIVLELTSPGGSVFAGFELMKAMEESAVPVVAVADMYCFSMCTAILASADVRLMTDRALLMFHEPSTSARGKASELEETAKVLRTLGESLGRHIAQKMCISYEEYAKRVDNKDYWVAAEEAQKICAVDVVVPSVDFVLQSLSQ